MKNQARSDLINGGIGFIIGCILAYSLISPFVYHINGYQSGQKDCINNESVYEYTIDTDGKDVWTPIKRNKE